MQTQFPYLLSPGKINGLSLRNRIFMSPMGSNLADPDGFSGERIRAYYAERAKGGAALITMGSVSIGYPEGASNWRQEAISDDKFIPGIKAIADSLHEHGAKLAVQLHHAGLTAMRDMQDGRPLAVPSIPKATKDSGDFVPTMLEDELEIFFEPYKTMGEVKYDVLTAQGIERIVQMYAAAADRAKRAGVDAVEIHAGHGYIVSSFLSPAYNQRTDEYGGTVENRSRLFTDIIKGIRAAVGRDYPVWARFDSQEFQMDDGITLEDAKRTAYLAQEAGLDAIHVSAHGDATRGGTYSLGHATDFPNHFVANAAAIKAVLDIPVICPGRIEPEDADRFIAEKKIDFVTMGRKLLADPHLARKLSEGRPQDVRPCIYCYSCISQIFVSKHLICAVNPQTGFERERTLEPAAIKKKIVVIGGGPGGMEAARLAKLKGHDVLLYERSDRLGGTAQFAAVAYAPNQRIVDWLKLQLKQLNVDIRYNVTVTAELLQSAKPDVVIVATGAKRELPPIPGAQQSFVFSGDDMRKLVLGQNLEAIKEKTDWATRGLMTLGALTGANKSAAVLREASTQWMPLGKRIVIVGGELVGLELAEFLAHRERTVTVLEETGKLGRGLALVRRFRVIDNCKELGVTLLTNAAGIEIGDHAVSYINENKQRRAIAADNVIVARGASGDLTLAEQLRKSDFNIQEIGDCKGVGYMEGAIRDAMLAVQAL